jgi:hypothetical protein
MDQQPAPAAPASPVGPAFAGALVDFLKRRLAEDRAVLGEAHCPVMLGTHHNIGTGGSTALVSIVRFGVHLDAIESLITKYETAIGWADRAREQGFSDGHIHQVAAVAYLDALQLHALEYATHPNYLSEWWPYGYATRPTKVDT